MSESINLENLKKNIQGLNEKVERLQSHNIALATLIGNVIDGELVSNSIHELSVLLDLSKNDLQKARKFISEYNGEQKTLKDSFINHEGKLSEENLIVIVQAFRNSSMLIEKCDNILTDFGVI